MISFYDPYFLDTRVSFGANLFDWEFAFEDFDRAGTGGGLRLSYPIAAALGYESLWGYPLEDVHVGNELPVGACPYFQF